MISNSQHIAPTISPFYECETTIIQALAMSYLLLPLHMHLAGFNRCTVSSPPEIQYPLY